MTWVALRRQRVQLITLLGILVLGSAAILLLRSISGGDMVRLGQIGVMVLPLLIGMFVGAPLFAREFEQGTHVLATSQAQNRTRWALGKIVIATVPAALVVLVLQWLVNDWVLAAGEAGPLHVGPYRGFNFDTSHVAPLSYTLFALALGMFAGALFKRTLVAMATTLGGFVVLRMALADQHHRLVPPERVVTAVAEETLVRPHNDLLLAGAGYLGPQGQPVSAEVEDVVLQACLPKGDGAPSCMIDLGLVSNLAYRIPVTAAGHMHLVEGAIFTGLAALLFTGTLFLLKRQT
ncbi:hypothetical protein D5S17_01040 [Pseudonocardiaceae bacterium YIM PH 21723]|nr:hypothetical protein D5S17_01040 [Pseudonocardiaceae bacterium YIM PH 21723]